MRTQRLRQFLAAAALATLGLTGCSSEKVSSHVNAVTGAECAPDGSYLPRPERGNGNGRGGERCEGTGPGDNCDDLHSGKIDCIGDGNSGQGDDRRHNCEFPQPGCDANGCCDDDIVEPPPGEGDDPDDGDDGGDDGDGDDGGDDGDGDDGGGEDPPPPPPEPEDPTPVPDVG